MNERSSGFFDEVLQQYFGSTLGSYARMRRADVEGLLTGDTRRRVARARAAALEWAATENIGIAEIAWERLLITPRGLLYHAQLSGSAPGAPRLPAPRLSMESADAAGQYASSRWTLYYLATPPLLLDPIIDGVAATPLPRGSAVAVDSRFGRDLVFLWPLDTALRRTLDAHEVLRVG